MTIIVYRDGVMAADTVGWSGTVKVPAMPKMTRRKDEVIGVCGRASDCVAVMNWFVDGGHEPELIEPDNFEAIVVCGDGSVINVDGKLKWTEAPDHFVAIGGPTDFAYGALYAGASAEETVRLCIAHTDGAGGDVQVEKIKPE